MAYKLIVEKYGKIEKAEIEIAPLTLFVGDNNSGKSFLLSLIWMFLSGEFQNIIYKEMEEILLEKYPELYQQVFAFINENDTDVKNTHVLIKEEKIIALINDLLERNKDNIVKYIFNYEKMSVGKIQIQSNEDRVFELLKKENGIKEIVVEIKIEGIVYRGYYSPKDKSLFSELTEFIFRGMIEGSLQKRTKKVSTYLPAARTGFMLAKNTINQVGRRKTFSIILDEKENKNDIEISPFPKPIIHFLDVMDNLNFETNNDENVELVNWIIENMSNGDVECIDKNSGSFQYIPNGEKEGIPLRATSGVVTELTPLILLLKYGRRLQSICYEEPEMCLHPQLQLNMAKLLVRMVNSGINMIVTTHSDIIIQHINNVCQLSRVSESKEILDTVNLQEQDLIDINNVAVYQLKDNGRSACVERIMPYNNMFEVSSFVNALGQILEQSMNISEFMDSREE